MLGNAMLTIVASTNATAAPSEAMANTFRGEGRSRRITLTGPMAGSADNPLAREPLRQVRVRGQRLARGDSAKLANAGQCSPFHQPHALHAGGDYHVGMQASGR